MKLYLLHDDKSIEREIELTPPKMVIGREVDTDIMLSVPGVSRYHCQLEFDDNNWTISDLGSTNGTKINKEQLSEPRILIPGDTLDVGEQLIRFGEASPTAATEIIESVKYDTTDTVINQQTPIQNDSNETEINIPVFDTTDTVKNVPIFNQTVNNIDFPQEPPKVIINLPGQSSGGGIIFEPLEKSPAETAVTPVPLQPPPPQQEKAKETEPAPMLTPEPSESMVMPMQNSKKESSGINIEKKNANDSKPSIKDESNDDDDDENYDANILRTVKLFGNKKGNNKKDQTDSSGAKKSKRKSTDLLFYVLVVCAPIVIISLFIMFNRKPQKPPEISHSGGDKRPTLVIVYEKKIISKDNVFRFAMALDGTQVEFVLDDLRSNRHFVKKDSKVSPELISNLLNDIKSTGFMELPEQTPGYPQDGIDERRTLKIGQDKQFKEVVIDNNAVPNSFEDIEQSINTFAEEYGLHTISMTPAELKDQAETAFNKAEELYKNRDAKPDNLLGAIKRYKLTMELLDQFAPKPREWNLSRKRLTQASKILEQQIADLKFDFSRYIKLKDYEKASFILKSLIPMLEPDSKAYKYYHKKQQALDSYFRRKIKK